MRAVECVDEADNRNILIVGWNASSNYGTSLQSLALYRALSKKYRCSLLWERKYLPFGSILRHLRLKRGSAAQASDEKKRERIRTCYEDADKTYINSRRQLSDALDRFSVFLVGGDQLWNPYLVENTYLLDFVPAGRRKISYATSIGMARLPDEAIPRYKKYLKRFDAVSMRDVDGARFMSAAVGKNVEVVTDPVFLLSKDEWIEFAQSSDELPQEYALLYFVGEGGDNIRKAVRSARDRGLSPVVVPMKQDDLSVDGTVESGIGPKEFLRLVVGASRVYTDSYHMCAFSLMFGKSFSVFMRFPSDVPCNPNSRVSELLSSFGIAARDGAVEPSAADIERYDKIIARERARSLDILTRVVEGV